MTQQPVGSSPSRSPKKRAKTLDEEADEIVDLVPIESPTSTSKKDYIVTTPEAAAPEQHKKEKVKRIRLKP